eukprot:gene29699-39387_t
MKNIIKGHQPLSTTISSFTNDFTTGYFDQTSSRRFDFPIHTIPNSADILFNINDKDFSDVDYLSSGSNVVVYTGISNHKLIVVKMLKVKIKNRKEAVDELNLEMQILAKVNHENIIRIIGAGEKPRKFITLEYLVGGTLDELLERQLFPSFLNDFMKILYSYLKSHKVLLFLALFLAAINQCFSLCDSIIVGKLLNQCGVGVANFHHDYDGFIKAVIGWLALSLGA